VFATFFNRMKRRVHQNWDPVSVWARHDPTGQVYGFKTRVTRVRVTLNPAGDLTKIIVSRSSGVDLLDDEAVRAFRAAQPFPNPPGGLVDASGNITFQFGFHLEIGGGRKAEWKIFRSL
jgi:TonB family protein